jgi:hypothetical protein
MPPAPKKASKADEPLKTPAADSAPAKKASTATPVVPITKRCGDLVYVVYATAVLLLSSPFFFHRALQAIGLPPVPTATGLVTAWRSIAAEPKADTTHAEYAAAFIIFPLALYLPISLLKGSPCAKDAGLLLCGAVTTFLTMTVPCKSVRDAPCSACHPAVVLFAGAVALAVRLSGSEPFSYARCAKKAGSCGVTCLAKSIVNVSLFVGLVVLLVDAFEWSRGVDPTMALLPSIKGTTAVLAKLLEPVFAVVVGVFMQARQAVRSTVASLGQKLVESTK